MVDNYGPTFGGYTVPTGPIAAPAQAEVIAQIQKLKDLIPDTEASQGPSPTGPAVSSAHPDFDTIVPERCVQLRLELDALMTAIDATPTS